MSVPLADQVEPPGGRPRTPPAVWVVCAALLAFSLLGIFNTIALTVANARGQLTGVSGLGYGLALNGAISLLNGVFAVFIFRRANWARWGAITLAAITAGGSVILALVAGGSPNLLGVVLQLAIIALLVRRDVKAWCV